MAEPVNCVPAMAWDTRRFLREDGALFVTGTFKVEAAGEIGSMTFLAEGTDVPHDRVGDLMAFTTAKTVRILLGGPGITQKNSLIRAIHGPTSHEPPGGWLRRDLMLPSGPVQLAGTSTIVGPITVTRGGNIEENVRAIVLPATTHFTLHTPSGAGAHAHAGFETDFAVDALAVRGNPEHALSVFVEHRVADQTDSADLSRSCLERMLQITGEGPPPFAGRWQVQPIR